MKEKGFTLVELMAVIVILSIILAIAVPTYRSYMASSRNKAFKEAENALKTAANNALTQCITNPTGEVVEYCKSHRPPDNQYQYDVAVGDELVKYNYIDPIADPYHSGKYCDMSKSYVYVSNKTNIDDEDNFDFVYKVCLACGDRKSEDCRDDILNQEKTEYETFCKVAYDSEGITIYDNKWTDQDLYLNFTSDGNFKYGINQYKYKIGSKSWKSLKAKENVASASITETIGDVEIKSEAYDGFNQKAEGICRGSDGSRIKIDKTKINSLTLIAKQTDGVVLTSGSWSLTDVVFTVTMDPRTIPSGYYYTWYKDGEVVNKTEEGTYKVTTRGTYKVEVTNGVGKQILTSEEFIVKIDKNKPTCTLASSGVKNGDWYIGDVTTVFTDTNDLEEDGLLGSGIVSQTIDKPKVSEDGASITITGTVIDAVGRKGTCKSVVKHDTKKPVVSSKNNPLSLGNGDYNFTSNLNVSFGPSGGTTVCNPATSRKTGTYTVNCTSTSNTNGQSTTVSFSTRHSYTANHWTTQYACCTSVGTCTQPAQCLKMCSSDCTSDAYHGWWGECSTCCKWADAYDYECCKRYGTCTEDHYSCPLGGNLSGGICYY